MESLLLFAGIRSLVESGIPRGRPDVQRRPTRFLLRYQSGRIEGRETQVG